jgi:hypothetical protein
MSKRRPSAPGLERIEPRWQGQCVIVAATGPSLTPAVAEQCRGDLIIAVNDAYRLLPFADVLYACDAKWWDLHQNCGGFSGEKWSTHDAKGNDKRKQAEAYGLRLVRGAPGTVRIGQRTEYRFSTDPEVIHYGGNSGFQAVNLAMLFGAARIVLVGFDMRMVGNSPHFFGSHPKPLSNTTNYASFIARFDQAAGAMPPGVEIVNATKDSALKCFPFISLEPLPMAAAA